MIDIRLVRAEPDRVAADLARRGVERRVVDELLELDAERRRLITRGDELRAGQKASGRAIGGAADASERERLIARTREVSAELGALEPAQQAAEEALTAALVRVPNLPHPDPPAGDNEADARELSTFGERPVFDHAVRDHVALGEALGLFELERAVRLSGSRCAYLKGQAVLLELALVRWAMDRCVTAGFVPVVPPVLTRREALVGTGFLPGSEEQIYRVPDDPEHPENDLYLTGTSEVALAGLHMDEILDAADLPLRYVGFSTCFRREAGTYGKDTSGIFRLHQFDKVEMFSFVHPSASEEEHARLLEIEVKMFTDLGLHGRVVDVALGDLGDPASRKFDVEVWLPGQAAYRELTSTSNTTDYQARRLRCRFREGPEGATEMVHTLNGTAVAVGRTLIALLETHQRADGTVRVPETLVPYTGFEIIRSAVAPAG